MGQLLTEVVGELLVLALLYWLRTTSAASHRALKGLRRDLRRDRAYTRRAMRAIVGRLDVLDARVDLHDQRLQIDTRDGTVAST